MNEVAVWYMSRGVAHVEVCPDEHEAVLYAMDLEERDDGAVSGVQYADGSLVKSQDWKAYNERRREEAGETLEQVRKEQKPEPIRHVRDPFTERDVVVLADRAPDWLGVHDE